MRIRNLARVFALATVLALVVAACSSSTGGSTTTSGSSTTIGGPTTTIGGSSTTTTTVPGREIRMYDEDPGGPPKPGGRLNLLLRIDAANIDPHVTGETTTYVLADLLYESLLEIVDGETKGGLATSWDVSDDGLTYTFELRQGVKFHSGREVTSEDVKYSLLRIVDPATASPRAGAFSFLKTAIIETPSPSTVIIELTEPFAPLLPMMTNSAAAIVDRDVAESVGLNGDVDGGTGPFTIASRVQGQEIILDKFPDYWEEGIPYLDGIDVTFNPDDNARAAAIRSGTVDFLWRAAPEFIDGLKADPDLKWYGGLGSLSMHLRLNVAREPFNDPLVRQAMAYALDRQQMVDLANSGNGTPLNAGFLPPDRWGSLDESIYGAANLEKARELLTEAGYPNGFSTTLMTLSTSAFAVRTSEVAVQQLAAVGIDVEIELGEATVNRDRSLSGDYDMWNTGFTLTVDPHQNLSSAFTSGGGANVSSWEDEEYDDLIARARVELDVDERERLYQESERILATRGPVLFTWNNADFDVVRSDVMGYRGDPTPGFKFYKRLWLDR